MRKAILLIVGIALLVTSGFLSYEIFQAFAENRMQTIDYLATMILLVFIGGAFSRKE